MLLILVLDMVYWILVVTGLVLALAWRTTKRRQVLLGVVTLFVLALGLPISSMLWPLDWLRPVKLVPARATLNGYTVSYIQTPGTDFYMDTLEINGADGKTAIVHINVDNGKCWFGWTELSEKVLVFHCFPWGRMATVRAAWLVQNMEWCKAARCDLSLSYLAQQ